MTTPRPADADGEDARLARDAAVVAAGLYAAFLNAPIPRNTRDVIWFTPGQAFELTRTLLYETLKDEET
jgi:hypothetical protein